MSKIKNVAINDTTTNDDDDYDYNNDDDDDNNNKQQSVQMKTTMCESCFETCVVRISVM